MKENVTLPAFSEAQTHAEVKAIYERRRKMLDEEFRTGYYNYCKATSTARRYYYNAEKDIKRKINELEVRLSIEKEKRDNIIADAKQTYSVQRMKAICAHNDLNLQRNLRIAQLDIVITGEQEGGEV